MKSFLFVIMHFVAVTVTAAALDNEPTEGPLFNWEDVLLVGGPKALASIHAAKAIARKLSDEFRLQAPLMNVNVSNVIDDVLADVETHVQLNLAATRSIEKSAKNVHHSLDLLSQACRAGLFSSMSVGQVFNNTASEDIRQSPVNVIQSVALSNSALRNLNQLIDMILLSLPNTNQSNIHPDDQNMDQLSAALRNFSAHFFRSNLRFNDELTKMILAADEGISRFRDDYAWVDTRSAGVAFCDYFDQQLAETHRRYAALYFFVRAYNEVMSSYGTRPSQQEPLLRESQNFNNMANRHQAWLNDIAQPAIRLIVAHKRNALNKWQDDILKNRVSRCFETYLI